MADTETFQHYQVLRQPDGTLWELGRGAMGVTYKAFDTNLRCHVALKVINAAYLESPIARQRFLREARAAAGLSHPNVASVFHLGESGGNHFYAMEFIDGETLEALVRRKGVLPPLLALQIALQVTRALRAAAREGLVHRDIKPANLMLVRQDEEDDVQVKVIDFGLAKLSRLDGENAGAISLAGFVGTPNFASPEQLEEKDLDVRSDMYSLGICLWYMLAGRPPFAGSIGQIMSQQLTRRPPFEQLAGIPPPVLHLLEHLLEKDAAKRPQTPADLRHEIEHVMRAPQVCGAPAADGAAAGPQEQGGTSFPTEAITEEPGVDHETGQAKSREPASGVILAARYRLLHRAGHGQSGDLFQAIELDSGRAVAVKILTSGSLAAGERFAQAQKEVNDARAWPHPDLLEIYALERSGEHTFLAFEWVNGFAVLDLLRNRPALSVPDALQLLDPLAAAADHAAAHGLPAPDVSPARVLLAFDAALDLPARTALLPAPLRAWPAFRPKVLPLSLHSQFATSPTWTGQQTMVPSMQMAPGIVRQLALLTYELLGGSPAAVSNSGGQAPAPLPALSEAGNAVLRAALHAGTAYASAADFAAALRASVSGSHAQAPERARPEPAPAVPPLQAREPAAAGAGGAGGLRSAVVPVIGLVILCTVVGMAGGLGLAAYNFLLPPAKRHSTQRPFVRRALPLETPTAAPSAPPMASAVPFPSAALNSPAPGAAAVSPAPPPTGDRAARFQELLAKAQGLERDGDAAGALDGYVALAQDYPEQGNGLSRLDAFVNDLVLSPLSPAAEHRRAQQLRPAMERAAGLGSAPAMIYLAGCYEQGNGGVKQNFERAFSLLNQAYGIDPNNATTVEKLAIDYERGNGTAVDTNKAFALMKRAVDLGSVKAISELGVYYMKGLGDQPQDPRMAVSLFQEGIGKNDAECMFLYAQCLYLGEGIRVNRAEAITYYRAAAEERFPPAQAWCRDNHVSFAGD